MKKSLQEIFGEKGVFLDQKISIHLNLQKGRLPSKRLGGFSLEMDGCGNPARKCAALLLLLCALALYRARKKKK